jgi:hypothetical protein
VKHTRVACASNCQRRAHVRVCLCASNCQKTPRHPPPTPRRRRDAAAAAAAAKRARALAIRMKTGHRCVQNCDSRTLALKQHMPSTRSLVPILWQCELNNPNKQQRATIASITRAPTIDWSVRSKAWPLLPTGGALESNPPLQRSTSARKGGFSPCPKLRTRTTASNNRDDGWRLQLS